MGLEVVVLRLVMKYPKKYMETMNSNQREIYIWTGIAMFNRLVLLEAALLSHDVPFKVKRGAILHTSTSASRGRSEIRKHAWSS
jgi:hypothetical protein